MVRPPYWRGDRRVRLERANQPVCVLRVVARDRSVHRGHVYQRKSARGPQFVQLITLYPAGCLLVPKSRGQASRRQRPELRDLELIGGPVVGQVPHLREGSEEFRAPEGRRRARTELIPRLHKERPHLTEERE